MSDRRIKTKEVKIRLRPAQHQRLKRSAEEDHRSMNEQVEAAIDLMLSTRKGREDN